MRREFLPILFCILIAFVCLGLLPIPASSQATDSQTAEVEQQLRSHYQGTVLVLRGFYSGDRLHYGPTGLPDKPAPADWTTDGFVKVIDISVSGRRLTIRARRLLVAHDETGFRLLANSPKKEEKAPKLEIAAELESDGTLAEESDLAMSRIFLGSHDSFVDMVPEYWKPCVADGLLFKNKNCYFPSELAAIAGMNGSNHYVPPVAPENHPSQTQSRTGSRVSPPRVIHQQDPVYSDAAQKANMRGTVTLMLEVESSGVPSRIRIVSPMGLGLDEEAVRALESWRFEPAKKDGQPVNVEIAIEMDFHQY
jgi:TonB family protein